MGFNHKGECEECGRWGDLNLDGLCSKCHAADEKARKGRVKRGACLDSENSELLMGLQEVSDHELS